MMRAGILFAAAVLAATISFFSGVLAEDAPMRPNAMSTTPSDLPVEGTFPSLAGATAWLNSRPLTPAELRGKVVLVQFWTYSCINWRRTMPSVRAWYEAYGKHGLVVIGVHTPEFAFEHDLANVRAASKELQVGYPVAVDSDYAVWRAFDNQYWPALYFIDAHGRVRHHHFGEGDEARSETVIRQLLAEAGQTGLPAGPAPVVARGAEVAADWTDLRSSETYAGYERATNFASPGGFVPDEPHGYVAPARLKLDDWALSGNWTAGRQATRVNAPGGRIAYRFHARDMHLVMGAANGSRSIRFRVTLDGRAPGAAHGADVDERGYGSVGEHRLYQVIRQSRPIGDRTVEIDFLEPGTEIYSFTFG
jgi:thiol-disulfide isomerase/thioredoxin